MILGTHNSCTYARPKKWYGFLMKPFAKCQDKDIVEQWESGVRCFDLRVRFDKENKAIIAHGLYEVDTHLHIDVLSTIDNLVQTERIGHPDSNVKGYVRVIMESLRGGSTDREKELFRSFCKLVEEINPHITFFGGNEKNGQWTPPVYEFKHKPRIIQAVSSMTYENDKVIPARWYEKVLPRRYAKRCNEENMKNLSRYKCIVLFDFI